MAINAAGERLRETINQLKELAEISGKATPELQQLSTALETLFQRGTGYRTSPTTKMVQDVHELLGLVESYGRSWRLVGNEIREAAALVGRIKHRQSEAGIPWHQRVENVRPEDMTRVQTTGSQQAINTLMEDETRLLFALDTGLDNLITKYESMGLTVGKVNTTLDATNKAYGFQVELLKQVGQEVQFVTKAQGRASAVTGRELAPNTLVQDLQTRLGSTARFEAFNKQLEGMGLSMKDLNSAQVDAVTGIARFAFQTGKAGEAVRTASFHFDKWGRAVGDQSNRFKSFGAALQNNILKTIKWGASVGIVYGALGKLQQIGTDMIEVQDIMVDLSITSGRAADDMGEYFESLADIADATGTDLKDSLTTMNAAMRAAGGETGAERTALALELVSDTAAYAKLSGLDMAKAMDILVSSLRQLNMPLSDGDMLLNKWVAVSKVAHTSLLDLGQAFATAAAAADSAGVGVDELNGLIATMAEVTNLSAQQSANAIRAILSSIQMASTQEVLGKYGIAVKEANGELRDMEDILTDVNLLITDFGDGAVLGEKAISELAYAMGGQGARRQAQTIALLKSLNRARDISNVSANASTDLEDALAQKTDTLSTAVERLETAFVGLSESLGGSGGLLDFATGVVTVLTKIIDGITDLTDGLGPATTAILLYASAWATLSKTSLGPKLGSFLGGRPGGMDPSLAVMAGGGGAGLSEATVSKLGNVVQAIGPAFAVGATHIYQAMSGEMTAKDAGQRIGASVAGSIVGNMILPGAGGLIGAVIADGIMGGLQDQRDRMESAFAPMASMDPDELAAAREFLEKEIADFEEAGFRISGPIGEGFGLWSVQLDDAKTRLADIDAALAKLKKFQTEGVVAQAPAQQRRYLEYQQQYQPRLETAFEKRKMELPFEFAAGEIDSARAYAQNLERMETLTNAMLPIFDAMSMGLRHNGEELGNASDKFVEMGEEMSYWSDESVQFILDQALAIVELSNNLEKTGEGYDELAARLKAFPKLYEGLRRTESAAQIQIPGFKDFQDYTQSEFDQIISAARALQEQFADQLGIPDEAFDSIERWAALVGQEFEWVEGVMEQFVMDAKSEFEELKDAQEDSFNVKRLKDVDPSQMGQIAQANRYWIEYMSRLKGMSAQEYLDVEGEQFNLILGEGNVLQQLNSTSEAMLFALQDIKDIEEKQLEGMWNIPSGATFWVPITSAFYDEGAGGGGYPSLPELIPPTERTANATEATEEGVREVGSGIGALTDTMQRMITDVSFDPGKVITDLFYELAKIGVKPSVGEGEDIWADQPEWLQNMLKPYEQPTEGYWSPEHMRDVLSEELMMPALDKLKPLEEEDTGLIATLTNLKEAIVTFSTRNVERGAGKGGYPGAEIMAPQEAPSVDVSVEIPEISGSFTIENKINLDGRQIMSYIDRQLSIALAKIARANAKASTGTMR